jgi:hypothetical protein
MLQRLGEAAQPIRVIYRRRLMRSPGMRAAFECACRSEMKTELPKLTRAAIDEIQVGQSRCASAYWRVSSAVAVSFTAAAQQRVAV